MTRCVANRNAMFGGANRDRRALRSSRRFSCRCRVRARSCSTVRTALRARRILGLLRIEAEYWFAPGIGAGLCCLRFRTLSLGGNVGLNMLTNMLLGGDIPKAGGTNIVAWIPKTEAATNDEAIVQANERVMQLMMEQRAMVGFNMGTVICQNTSLGPAPSSTAASSSSTGIVWRPAR